MAILKSFEAVLYFDKVQYKGTFYERYPLNSQLRFHIAVIIPKITQR
jgi:hypothetical protein